MNKTPIYFQMKEFFNVALGFVSIFIVFFTFMMFYELVTGSSSFEEIMTVYIMRFDTFVFLVTEGWLVIQYYAFKRDMKETEEFKNGRKFYRQQVHDYEADNEKFEKKEDSYLAFIREASGNYKIFCFREGFKHERKNGEKIIEVKKEKKLVSDKIDELLSD